MKLIALSVKDFKSFEEINLDKLDLLTILIGVNGAGKSNVLSVLDFISNALKIGINPYLKSINKLDLKDFLHNWDTKKAIEIKTTLLDTSSNIEYCYEFSLEHSNQNRFKVVYERLSNKYSDELITYNHNIQSESLALKNNFSNSSIETKIYHFLINIISYNFYNSVLFSKRISVCEIDNCEYLNNQYTNFVAVLYNIKLHALDNYLVIKNIVKMLVPSFDDFVFEENSSNIQLKIKLYNSQISNDLSLLSEGTIRILVLSVLLNLPALNRPSILILEEPEIALHHNVLDMIADLIDRYSKDNQIILVTQSPHLLNKVSIDNLYVLKLNKELTYSYAQRVDKEQIQQWLKEYRIGELWIMNIIGGNPF